jgi:type IV secretory pathway VirB9-like protein
MVYQRRLKHPGKSRQVRPTARCQPDAGYNPKEYMKKIAIFVAMFAALGIQAHAGESTANTYKIINAPAPAFTPVKVWDDGQFTFIELAKPYGGDLPVVFALGEDGSRFLVNFQWDEKNSRIIVQRLFDRAVLVSGDKSVVISRT